MRRFSTAPCYTHYRLAYRYRKREPNWFPLTAFGGERGIRTPGASQHGGFQDRCNRPLYHLSIVQMVKSVYMSYLRVQR